MALTRVDQYLLDTEISAEITANAVDVFIYDTSKDSDGGAWRKRTAHTSWYNETLNTATRGARREFPSVAVIVAQSDKVTIYDADDPDLPMWMVFNKPSNGYTEAIAYGTNLRAVYQLNGKLAVSTSDGQSLIDFISEDCRTLRASGQINKNGAMYGGIVNRNGNMVFVLNIFDISYNVGNSSSCNDVAITVLPNAPIDPSTGLPTPTIAVATDGGVSVIKDDGSVVDSAFTASVNYLSFSENGDRLFVSRNDSRVFTSSITSSISADGWGNDNEYYRKDATNTTNFPWINEDSSGSATSRKNEKNVYGSQFGLTIIDETPGVTGTGMGAWITSDYNTGWMHGDIKGAFLADTDATNVTGSELVTNGDFSSNSDWTLGTGYSISGGLLSDTSSSSSSSTSSTPFALAIGTHTLSYQATGSGGLPTVYVRKSSDDTAVATLQISSDPFDGVMTTTFNVTSAENYYVEINGTNFTGTYDYISIRIADPDRSVNNKGLQVFGTITKSAVATGAELVAYSGWSTSNYLEQPYNSDLDFGTGDFSVMFWTKIVPVTGSYTLFEINYSSGNFNFYVDGLGTAITIVGSKMYQDKSTNNTGWSYHTILRKNGVFMYYSNGNFIKQASSTENLSTFTSLKIGYGYLNLPISLFRISKSAPSPEQIKKIYEDEKVLFQENAACTLYGASDAITALAYDEVTERLHVGTSFGRSDFQGLRRISNTTTPITTALSAYDGFIVEQ